MPRSYFTRFITSQITHNTSIQNDRICAMWWYTSEYMMLMMMMMMLIYTSTYISIYFRLFEKKKKNQIIKFNYIYSGLAVGWYGGCNMLFLTVHSVLYSYSCQKYGKWNECKKEKPKMKIINLLKHFHFSIHTSPISSHLISISLCIFWKLNLNSSYIRRYGKVIHINVHRF